MMRRRRGFSLFEAAVSMMLLGVMFTVSLQMLTALAAHRRAISRRAWAVQTTANLVERFSAREWSAISPETASQLTLPSETDEVLPHARLRIEVVAQGDTPPAKRITAALTWQDRTGQPAAPIRLTTWVHQAGELSE